MLYTSMYQYKLRQTLMHFAICLVQGGLWPMRFLLEMKLIVTNVFANVHCHCLLSQQEKSHHLSNEKVIFNINLKRNITM